MTSGLYLVAQEPTDPNIVTLRLVSNGSGGSHEEMWRQFLIFLIEVENTIVRSQGQMPDAVEAVRVSTELRAHLCRQGKANGAWPSTVRNALNYRHDYGVWYPYGRTAKQCSELTTRMSKWRPDADGMLNIGSSNDDLARFADVCNVVTHFLTASLRDISKRSTLTGKSFVDRYPFKLLRLRQVAV